MTPSEVTIPYGFCHCGCGKKTTIADHDEPRYNARKGEPRRYIRGHGNCRPIEVRFWKYVAKTSGCWLWKAAVGPTGYGSISLRGKCLLAHRVGYELAFGKIPENVDIHHICRNRRCVKPAHLKAFSPAEHALEHVMDTVYCRNGHPRNESTSRIRRNVRGDVVKYFFDCLECERAAQRRRRALKKSA